MERSKLIKQLKKYAIELVVAGVVGNSLTWLSTREMFSAKDNLDAWGVILQEKIQPYVWIILLVMVVLLCAQEHFLLTDKTVTDKELMPFETYRKTAIALRLGISVVGLIVELICRPITNGHVLLSILVGLLFYFFIGLFEKVNWLFGEILFHPVIFASAVILTSIGLFLVINACIVPVLMLAVIIIMALVLLGIFSGVSQGDYGYVDIIGLGSFFYYKY